MGSIADGGWAAGSSPRPKRADPWVAAMHWKGLNEWDMFEKRLLGAIRGPDLVEINRASTLAADAFLQLYGPEKPKKKARAKG